MVKDLTCVEQGRGFKSFWVIMWVSSWHFMTNCIKVWYVDSRTCLGQSVHNRPLSWLVPQHPVSHRNACELCRMKEMVRMADNGMGSTCIDVYLDTVIHIDLCGKPPTMGGSLYYMLVVDDVSRKMWVHFLREKAEAFKIFKRWHKFVEREFGNLVKELCSDGGGEFL